MSPLRLLGLPVAGPEDVVMDAGGHLLTGLATNAVPAAVLRGLPFRTRARLATPHLPQGAPTSPALANLAALALDRRLHALATSLGATYTRYADDLAFSGDRSFARSAERFATRAAAIALEAGFHINHRKTRLMRASVRQHLAGLTVHPTQ